MAQVVDFIENLTFNKFLNCTTNNTQVNILVTGIPGVGKSEMIQANLNLLDPNVLDPGLVSTLSTGEIFRELVSREYRILPERVPNIEENVALAFRSALLSELLVRRHPGARHLIVDTPLTILRSDTRIVRTFSMQNLMRFSEKIGKIDWVVCVIDAVPIIRKRMEAKAKSAGHVYSHPTEKEYLLGWIATEVVRSQDLAEALGSRLLITSAEHAETSLIKLLFDPDPILVYYGHPITNASSIIKEEDLMDVEGLRQRLADLVTPGRDLREMLDCLGVDQIKKGIDDAKDALTKLIRGKILNFGKRLEEHCVVTYPIALADGEASDADRAYTFQRDLYWFLANADAMVAYFPLVMPSKGVDREFSEAEITGKPFALVHPKPFEDKHPFKAMPPDDCRFRDEREFFESLGRLPSPFSKMRVDGRPRYEGITAKNYKGIGAHVK